MVYIPDFAVSHMIAIGLLFVIFVPSIVFALWSVCSIRRRGDWARTWTLFLKLAFANLLVFLFLEMVAFAANVSWATITLDTASFSSWDYDRVQLLDALHQLEVYVTSVSRLFGAFMDVLILPALIYLGIGIVRTRDEGAGMLVRVSKWGSLALSAILAVLALASFGLRIHANVLTIDISLGRGDSKDVDLSETAEMFDNATKLNFAFYILVWIVSLAVAAASVLVMVRGRGHEPTKTASIYFLACSFVWLVRTTFTFVVEIKWGQYRDWLGGHREGHHQWNIVNVVLAVWPLFVILTVLFFLGRKTFRGGLYSTENQVKPEAYEPYQGQQQYQQEYKDQQQYPQQYQPVYNPTDAYGIMQQPYPQQPYQPEHEQRHVPTDPSVSDMYSVSQNSYSPHQQHQSMFSPVSPVSQHPKQHQTPAPQTPMAGYYSSHASIHSGGVHSSQSPPPPQHDEIMGYNHQADGTTPAAPEPYPTKQ